MAITSHALAAKKRVNRTDLTLRNLHAMNKRLDKRIDRLEQQMAKAVAMFTDFVTRVRKQESK